MKIQKFLLSIICCLFSFIAVEKLVGQISLPDVNVGIDPAVINNGFMVVRELDRTGVNPKPGAVISGNSWNFNDLSAVYNAAGTTLTLSPNSIDDPSTEWYIGGGGPGALGNRWMDANSFVEFSDGSLSGVNLTFSGEIISNTLTQNHRVRAFIKDFGPVGDPPTVVSQLLTNGSFSLNLMTSPTGRFVQYGFSFTGENVWETELPAFGSVVLRTTTAVPEPGGIVVCGVATIGLLTRRKRRNPRR